MTTATDWDKVAGLGVRARRLELGLSQRELADLLRERGWSIDSAALTRVEKGERSLRVSQLALIADALRCPPDDLLTYEADEMERLRLSIEGNLLQARVLAGRAAQELVTYERLGAHSRFEHQPAELLLEVVKDVTAQIVANPEAFRVVSAPEALLSGLRDVVTSTVVNGLIGSEEVQGGFDPEA